MTLLSGSRIGPYEITGSIGAGGMGEVFRARDTKLNRDVAIKVLPAAFAQDHDRVARFRREAQLLASFNHPNIAAIHGLEEIASTLRPGSAQAGSAQAGSAQAGSGTGAVLALALELVEGEDLAQRLRRGPIPVDEALGIARQIAEGLEAAHEKGIVHRDLKPANIKVTPEGQVKVLDFGLAKAFDTEGGADSGSKSVPELARAEPGRSVEARRAELARAEPGRSVEARRAELVEASHSPTMSRHATEAGIILGTAAYMSPEQARGKTVDKRADIWSFGVVMFEMVSGRRLFQGETASDTLAAVLRQDIDWSLLPKELSPADRRLIERCLERDPKKRLRDIGEARIQLESPRTALAAAIASSAGVSRRTWLGIAGAGVGGFAAGLGLGVKTRGSATPSVKGTALSITSITGSGNVIAAAISPDGRYVAYVESEQGLQSLWLLQLAGGQTLRLTPDAVVGFWGHTFTPDGNSIIYGSKAATDPEGSLYSISTLGGTPRRILGSMDSQVSFSPDARRFAYTRLRHPTPEESSLMVADADGGNARALATFKLPEAVAGIFFGAPAWSPDGNVIATSVFRRGSVQGAETRARLVAVDVNTGAVKTIADPGWFVAAQCAWLPDGKSLLLIASASQQATTQIWSVAYPGGETRQVTADLNDHRILSLTKDGKTLLSISGDVSSTITTVPLHGGGKPRRIGRSKFDGFAGIGFAPDGDLIYTSSVSGAWSLWKSRLDGSNRLPLFTASPEDDVSWLSVSRDGTLFYAVRNRSGVEIRATLKDGSSTRSVVREVRFERLGLLPDGGVVFAANVSGIPRLFTVPASGGERRQVVEPAAFFPAVDPAGKRVAYYFFDKDGRFRVGVSAMDDGRLLSDFTVEPNTSNSRLILRDEGVYLNTVTGDRANVWLQALDGKPARRITNYEDQLLFDFEISPDGETLAVVRGPRVRDAQLITGF